MQVRRRRAWLGEPVSLSGACGRSPVAAAVIEAVQDDSVPGSGTVSCHRVQRVNDEEGR